METVRPKPKTPRLTTVPDAPAPGGESTHERSATHAAVQPMQDEEYPAESALLQRVSQRIYAAVAAYASANGDAKIAGQLPLLRERLFEARQNPETALRALWGAQFQDAPSGLLPTIESHLALREPPSGVPENPGQAAQTNRRVQLPDAIVAVFAALGYVLSARMLLLLSMTGAFVLGAIAMVAPSPMRLAVLVAYVLFTVIPVALLEAFGKRPKEIE